MSDSAPVLLYDGLCGFCDMVVQFVLAQDRQAVIRFAPLQGEFARALIARHPELRDVDSLIFVEGANTPEERVFVKSEGAARVARYLGSVDRMIARVTAIVPRFIRDAAYDAFARVRYRVFGRRESCRVPSADQRARFLD